MSGTSNGASQSSSSKTGVPFDDPRSLLRVYPFATYTPTARVAEHFSAHTTTYQEPPTPSSLYPQHAEQFGRMDKPQSAQDWQMRQESESRLREMLAGAQQRGETYGRMPYPSPDGMSDMTYPPDPQGSSLPMPYHFLPSHDQGYRDPPTPASLPSPSHSTSASAFFEKYVDDITARSGTTNGRTNGDQSRTESSTPTKSRQPDPAPASASASVNTTPTIARTLASTSIAPEDLESPDPLAMSGPSPSKKPRYTGRPVSPVRTHSNLKIKLKLDKHRIGQSSSTTSVSSLPQHAGPSSSSQGGRKKSVPEVVIPVRKRSTSPAKPVEDDEDSDEDALDWGDSSVVDQDGDYEMSDPAFISPSPTRRVEMQGSGRTGERDQRSSFQKLQSYLEDVFEESDSFPAEISQEDIQSSKFFSAISQSGSHPLLSLRSIGKVVDYATRLKGKRNTVGYEWDTEALTRILRTLEKSMREVDEITVFAEPKSVEAVNGGKKPSKTVKGKKSSKSPDIVEEQDVKVEDELTEDRARYLESELHKVATAGAAAAAVLALLDLEGLSKQMYSEDLLSLAVSLTKDQMTKVIFPVVSCLNGEKTTSAFLTRTAAREGSSSKSTKLAGPFAHPSLTQVVRSTLLALPRITSLISRVDMSFSDSLVIQAVYLSIGPLFLAESSSPPKKKGKEKALGGDQIASLMKTFRTEAMGCLRATFARYENQRQWIIEEILSSIVKVPDQTGSRMRFQLANGNAIHTMSALLLQLLQASSYGAVSRVRKLRATMLEAEIMETTAEKLDVLQEEAKVCSEAIESVFTSAKMVATYLVQRSGTSKANKTSLDTDYKAVLDTLVGDLLTVLYRPEWPAASLFLNVLSRLMMNSVEDTKAGSDNAAAKSIALDHLGDIAARIRSLGKEMSIQPTPSFDEVISAADPDGAKALVGSHACIDNCLSASAGEDDMYSCARDMTCVVWAQELHAAIHKIGSIVDKLSAEKDEDAVAEREKLQIIVQTFKSASRDVWQVNDRLFETKDPRQAEHALKASISLARGRSLQSAFDPILRAIGASMDSTVVALRSKALRALSSIIVVDPDVLAMPFVKQALEERLSDTSPAVRDAAVDLVGKYIVQKPTLAAEYYRHIAERIEDSGVGVRKRVIKLLTGIFGSVADAAIQSEICCRLIDAMGDHDDAVKALATKSLAELLYPADGSGNPISLLTEIVSEYHGDPRSLELAMQNVVKEISGGVARYRTTVEALVSRLIDATEQPEFDALSHVKAIHLLCASDPSLIDTGKASVLLSYLRAPVKNPDDQATNDTLLRIFKRSIPSMPRVTSTFATDLVKTLAPMVNKPSGGFSALKELVSCLCVTISHLTRDFQPLTRMLRACEDVRIQYTKTAPEAASSHVAAYMLYITALIVENVNLDQLAEDDDLVQREIRTITELRLSEYFFDLYLDLSRYSIFQNAPSIALGSLFHAYPSLILRDEAVEWMQQVFASNDLESQARLFRVIHEFLESEVERKASGKVDKDITALIGNNQEFTESGVSTAVVQRNIGAILNGSKSAHPGLQDAALGVLDFTVRQGLYHPLECLPILISLETSEVPIVAEKALALHAHLHTKHASLVNIRFLDFARASYEYQRSITAEVSGHRHGQALLQGWYTLISEKRAWRIDLLKSFCRAFDYDVSKKTTVNIGLVLYLSDNLATFEYKLQDEPMSVVHFLGTVIASCIHLASMLESGSIEGDPGDLVEGKKLVVPNSEEVVYAESAINASIVVCLALVTKNHLLNMWGLSEDKCLKHTPGKKSAMGDKPAHRKGLMGLDLNRLPLVRGVRTVDEFRSQAATFLQLLTEDGSLGDH